MLNMVFGSFSTPTRCCWPSSTIQRWGKEWSTMRLRVPLWSNFGVESECGGGRCLRYFDHKILLCYAEHGFGSFKNPIRCCWTSSDIQGWGNEWSKMRLREHLWSSFGEESECGGVHFFTILWSQNPSILCWTWFWLFFNPKQVLRSNIYPFGVPHYVHKRSALKHKTDIYIWDPYLYLIILLEVMPSQAEFTRERFF